MVRIWFYRGVKEWALATAAPCRPQTFPAGTLLVPLSEPSSRRIDPLRGPCPPLPPAAAPPEFHQKRKIKISAAGVHVEKRGVADDLLANWLTLPQPPQRGGMSHEATKICSLIDLARVVYKRAPPSAKRSLWGLRMVCPSTLRPMVLSWSRGAHA